MPQAKKTAAFLLFIVLVLGGLAAGVLGYQWLRGRANPNPVLETARLVPDSMDALVAARDLGLAATGLKSLLETQANPKNQDLAKDLKAQLGFDPLDPAAWQGAGFDLARPWVVAVRETGKREGVGLALVPLLDEKAAVARLKEVFERQKKPLAEVDRDGTHLWLLKEGERVVVAFAAANAHLYALSGTASVPADTELVRVLKVGRGESLAQNPELRRLATEAGGGWQLFAWASPKAIEEVRKGAEVEGVSARSMAGTVTLRDDRIAATLLGLEDPALKTGELFSRATDTFAERVPGAALVAARLSVNLKKWWERAQQTPEGKRWAEQVSRDLATKYGIDFEKDVLPTFEGRVSVAVMSAPEKHGLVPVEAGVWLPVADDAKAVELLQKLAAKSPLGPPAEEQAKDGTFFKSQGAVLGVTQHHVVALYDEAFLEKVRAPRDNTSPSFLKLLPPKVKAALDGGPAFYLFVDVAKIVAAANAHPLARLAVPKDQLDVAASIAGFTVSADMKGELFVLEAELLAGPAGFKPLLAELEKTLREKAGSALEPEAEPDDEHGHDYVAGKDPQQALRVVYAAERAWFAEHDGYTNDVGQLGLEPDPDSAYVLFLDGKTLVAGGKARAVPSTFAETGCTVVPVFKEHAGTPGILGTCPHCELTLVAAAPAEHGWDCWSVSTAPRGTPESEIPSGIAYHESTGELDGDLEPQSLPEDEGSGVAALEHQSEAQRRLAEVFAREQQFKAKSGKYTARFTDLGLDAAPDTYYSVFLGLEPSDDNVLVALTPYGIGAKSVEATSCIDVVPGVADDKFLAVAAGIIDGGSYYDCWSVASYDRTLDGTSVPAGKPHNDRGPIKEGAR